LHRIAQSASYTGNSTFSESQQTLVHALALVEGCRLSHNQAVQQAVNELSPLAQTTADKLV